MEAYHEEHKTFRMDAEGRNARHTLIEMEASIWKVEQVLQDFEDLNDWSLRFEVDLAASRTQGAPVLKLNGFDTLG
jgi:hypothetical protein